MSDFWMGCLYSLIGCLGFCLAYNLRGRVVVLSALGGALGWLAFELLAFSSNDIFQYFGATVVISVYAEVMARLFRTPVTVFLVVALLPLVPGSGIYYTMEHCIAGEMDQFLQMGAHTLFIAGALAIGILVVSAATQLIRRMKAALRRPAA